MNWSQLRTIVWLRWRLTRNQWSRAGALNAVITMIAAIGGLLIAVAGGVGGVIGGAFALAHAPPAVLLLVWDAIVGLFLLAWTIGLLTELQRSETIDLGRLLHLPVSLRDIFLINYLASHVSFSLILFLPGMLGLSAGLMWSRGAQMALLFPLVLGFVFMVTAWTYCLRGWLVALMVNQRRRRAIIAGMTMGFILLSQAPNLYFNIIGQRHSTGPAAAQANRRSHLNLPPSFIKAHRYVPPLWVAGGALDLATGNAWPALSASLAALLIGGLGLRRAYRATVRFYQGDAARKPPPVAPAPPVGAGVPATNFLEKRLPGLPDEVTALALAFFRSLTRAAEAKMMLGANLLMPLVLAAMFFSGGASPPDAAKPFLATAAVGFTFLGLVQLLFNQFGFDREGFRALVLLPVPRRQILLAKNLAFLPIAGGIGVIFLALVAVVIRLPLLAFLAALCQLAATFLLMGLVGNYISVVAPYRIGVGSLKPTKTPAKTMLLVFASHLTFPFVVAPMFAAPALGLLSESLGWSPANPVNLLLSLLWLAAMGLVYWLSLDALGRLLQRREMEILQKVTHEVE